MKFSLIAFNCRFTHSCLSLFYLRKELIKNIEDLEVNINQFTINDPYYQTLLHIAALEADAFFFSVYIWNALIVKRIIDDLAKIQPFSRFILGGPQAQAFSIVDFPTNTTIVRGEIEGIDASFFADLKSGELKQSYIGDRPLKFDSPYSHDDFQEHLLNRSVYYESARGCPFSCSYCISSLEPGIRYKDIQKVFNELKEILTHSPKSLRFVDRTFNASAKRALEIWEFLQKESTATSFHFEISPDLFSEKIFNFLEKIPPGLFEFEVGIQSTHEATLAAINRKTDIRSALDNIKRLIKIGTVHVHVDLILGLPFETMETFEKSFNDIFATGPHYIQMGLLKILPNTPISQKLQEFSIQHCIFPPYEVLATKWLTQNEIAELFWFGECVEAFYNNRYFRSFFQFLRENDYDSFQFFTNLLKFCRQHAFFSKAKTQIFLSDLLNEFIRTDPNYPVLKELLVYDWLRSGHRFLPEHLGQTLLKEEKDRLWHELPQALLPFYTHTDRNNFFKHSLFIRFSGETLKQLGITDGQKGVLCFFNERENTLLELNKVALLSH